MAISMLNIHTDKEIGQHSVYINENTTIIQLATKYNK